MSSLRLVRATPTLSEAFLELAREYREARDHRYDAVLRDLDAFFAKLEQDGEEDVSRPKIVPQSHYWLVDNHLRILACARLRHRLSAHLEIEGGHIGYDVRPSERGRGVGTRLLAFVLDEARALGLDQVLITCDDDNVASARIIEKNGGVESTTRVSPRTLKTVRRFWIALA